MKRVSSRSSLLLIEIIIAILIFSVASAVCLQLFAKSHTLSKRTEELDIAVREATSVSELLAQGDTLKKNLTRFYPYADITPDSAVIYYDIDFQPCERRQSYFQMNILPSSRQDRIRAYTITVCKDSNTATIYRMETTAYEPLRP